MNIFSVLAEPTRMSIVEMLATQGQMPASDISAHFSVSVPAISQHLKVLREADVVRVKKKAQQRIYTLNQLKLAELEVWARDMQNKWNPRFEALEELLKQEQSILSSQKNSLKTKK